MSKETELIKEEKALHIGSVMPSSCLFNGQRRAVIKETESFYFFAVGNRFEWNYAEKYLCTDLN